MAQIQIMGEQAPACAQDSMSLEVSVDFLQWQTFRQGHGGFEATGHVRAGLEAAINDIFSERKLVLDPSYRDSPVWRNFLYLVALIEGKESFNPNSSDYRRIAGLLTAFYAVTPEGTRFVHYDTIGFNKKYRGCHKLRRLLQAADEANRNLGISLGGQDTLPAGLRTSDEEADLKYTAMSDYRIPQTHTTNGNKPYFAHVFGANICQDPMESYLRADEIASYLFKLPPKFRMIH